MRGGLAPPAPQAGRDRGHPLHPVPPPHARPARRPFTGQCEDSKLMKV